jgi:hypothetical protein
MPVLFCGRSETWTYTVPRPILKVWCMLFRMLKLGVTGRCRISMAIQKRPTTFSVSRSGTNFALVDRANLGDWNVHMKYETSCGLRHGPPLPHTRLSQPPPPRLQPSPLWRLNRTGIIELYHQHGDKLALWGTRKLRSTCMSRVAQYQNTTVLCKLFRCEPH